MDELKDDTEAPWEEGFEQGEEDGGKDAKCRKCGKILMDDFVETEINDEYMRFCSDYCAQQFNEEH